MQDGDLEVSVRQHYVVVLEGVLAQIDEVVRERRFRHDQVTGYNIHWLDIPLRRLATNKRQYPDMGAEIVTFVSEEVADQAASFLDSAGIDHDSMMYQPFGDFCTLLKFRDGLRGVYDSDPDRIRLYGQWGHQVTRGDDW